MEIIAIIPARGSSKGIPRKNVRLLAGKPLIAWAIEAALAAKMVSRVVVSTEDKEIAEVSRRFGAEVIRRPAELATDTTSSELVLLHVLEVLQQKEEYQSDIIVFLQCTSPLTLPEDVDGAVKTLTEKGYDSLLSVKEFHYFIWQVDKKGDPVGVNHDKSVRLMRQQREPQYQENGAIYVMRTSGFLKAKHRFFGRAGLYVMLPERSYEIDTEGDFTVAEALLKAAGR